MSVSKRVLYGVRLTICAALLAWLVLVHDAAAVVGRLEQVHAGWFSAAMLAMYIAVFLSAWQWQSILRAYGRRESLLRLWRLCLEGNFFNLFFPGSIAGDISRIAQTSTRASAAEGIAAVLVERVVALGVMSLFVGVVAALGGYHALGLAWQVAILGGTLAVVAGLSLLMHARSVVILAPWLPGRARRLVGAAAQLQSVVQLAASDRPLVWKLAALSLAFTLLMGPGVYFVAQSVAVDIPLSLLMIYGPLTGLAAALPVSISGVGVREAIAVLVYPALGFRPEDALALALAHSATRLLVNLSGGLSLLGPNTLGTEPVA